ncbi:MAG TPA: selenocysteine-specific translation elongation factor [Deltaproteobacteria bacterium]|nr:selenocysteine-specific translation elongation factor [Deltaproteobacteria bacterium]
MDGTATIGVAGHVDHGKTTLVRSLTGIDTDRMKQEKERGLSIEFGVAPFVLPSGLQLSLIDVPGHTDFMKNTIRGLNAVDAAILVVAADDGIMPQTREHLQILEFFGVEKGFVVLSKADLVDADTLDLAALEVDDLTPGSFLEGCPIIPFYGGTGAGREEIVNAVEQLAEGACREKDRISPFRLFIDQVRTFQGIGTVVSGTVLSGTVRQSDTVEIIPAGLTARVRSIETHHSATTSATAGSRVGISLQGVSLQKISRGMVLAEPGTIATERFLNAEISVSPLSKHELHTGQRIKVFLHSACTGALAVMIEGRKLGPGETGLVQLRLNGPVGAVPGDCLVITPLNDPHVIGGGRVLETTPSKFRKAHTARVLPYLKALQEEDLSGIVRALLSAYPGKSVCAQELSRSTRFASHRFKETLHAEQRAGRLVCVGDGRYLSAQDVLEAKKAIRDFVEKTLRDDAARDHVSAAAIKSSFKHRVESCAIDVILRDLVAEGSLVSVNGGYSIRSIHQQRSSLRSLLMQQTQRIVEDSGPVPLTLSAVRDRMEPKQEKKDVQKILEHLVAGGDLVRLDNDRYLSRKGALLIKALVKKHITTHGKMTLADCNEVLGYGRTVGTSILEYLDKIGYTKRIGNERVMKP